MLKVIESIGKDKFIAIITDAESAMQATERRVMNKYPHQLGV